MVSYHSRRIKQDYISDLRLSFKAYDAERKRHDASTTADQSVVEVALSALHDLLFNDLPSETSTFDNHTKLIVASYNLRRETAVEGALNSRASSTLGSRKLWRSICLFSRIRVAYHTFIETGQTLPSFAHVSFILVRRPNVAPNPPQRPTTLKQTFGVLKLDLNSNITKEVLGKDWTVSKTEDRFKKLQKQNLNVHAEVQMLIVLAANEPVKSDLFPYFGCSKLSCFMCSHFIQAYGRFTTRGCHGRLFKPWTVPNADGLLPGQTDRIARALVSVQKELKKKLKESIETHVRHEQTSVVGGSSIVSEWPEKTSSRRSQIDQLRAKGVHERVLESFRRSVIFQTHGPSIFVRTGPSTNRYRQDKDTARSAQSGYSPPDGGKITRECNVCDRRTTSKCSICNKDSFCSERCEDKMPSSHLFTCSKRPLTTADYLWNSLARDLIPQEEDVLEDFGFNNAGFGQERSYLFGVYAGLYRSGRFSAEELHEWRIAGILTEKIKGFFYSIPEESRGSYFPWLLKNLHVLGRPMTREEANRNLAATLFDKARSYLDVEDRNKALDELMPIAKRDSFILLAELSHQASPNPIEQGWYNFGFVTCRGEREENTLVQVYQLLLLQDDGSYFYKFYNSRRNHDQPVSLTQFWEAYEAGKLIQLMDSKGLHNLRSGLPFLEAFLSAPPAGSRPSVWDLKWSLDIEDPVSYPPIPSVSFDYGFVNCGTMEETYTLMEIYKRVLQTVHPLGLHHACITGTLWQFASGYIRMEERWRPLMKNVYPLETPIVSETGEGTIPGAGSEAHEKSDVISPSLLSRLWGSLSIF